MRRNDTMVSVIIPFYNVEKYIAKCIESVIHQSYRNIEIIMVDDGSPDSSSLIVKEYVKKDSRIKLIQKENGGVASARNCGIRKAGGEFLAFVDSDDWVAEDYISHLMELQKREDADLCMTTRFFVQKCDVQEPQTDVRTITNEEAAILLLSPEMVVGSYNKLYRRRWLIDNDIWQNEKLYSGEGLHFIVTAAQYANRVTVSNRRIYYYRRNVPESATTKFNINMFTNNELSLDILEQDRIIDSKRMKIMTDLFREHLMISGMMAVLACPVPTQYEKEYQTWKKKTRSLGKRLLGCKEVPLRSKIRIIGAAVCPRLWARMAECKRNKIFRGSV